MPTTQGRPFGAFTGRRFSSFAGKTADSGSTHPVGVLTQTRPFGAFTGRRFASFAGKTGGVDFDVDPTTLAIAGVIGLSADVAYVAGSAHPVGVLTQLRPYGAFAGKRFGSFGSKAGTASSEWDAATPIPLPLISGTVGLSGDVRFSSVFALENASAIGLSGAVGVSADAQFVTAWDLADATPIGISGAVSLSADVSYSATAFTSAGVLYVPIRMVSSLWSAGNVGGAAGEVAWLPPARQPMVYTDTRTGQMFCDPAWYRFFEYIAETRLAGKTGPTLTSVVQTLTDTQTTAAAATVTVTELQQQTQANAEALYVTREVVKYGGLPGAEQIPFVEL